MDQMVVGHSTSCSDHHSWLHKDHEQHLRDSQVFNQDINIFGHVSGRRSRREAVTRAADTVEDFTGQPPHTPQPPAKKLCIF